MVDEPLPNSREIRLHAEAGAIGQFEVTYHAAHAYTAMQVAEAAVKAAGSSELEKIRDAMASIAVYTVSGLYKPNEQGMSFEDGLAIQIQNGKHVIVWPNRFAEAKALPMPKWEDKAKK